MKRREFISLLGGAVAAWPIAARAQQSAMPVVGLLGSMSAGSNTANIDSFRQGLKELGFLESQNVIVEYRWAEGEYDRLPPLAQELNLRQVAVIFAVGPPAALAAKAATSNVPIVFTSGDDPVESGLVASLSRPGGNVTGISIQFRETIAKRLELLHDLATASRTFGLLAHPRSSNEDVEAAARTKGLRLYTAHAAREHDLEAAFESLVLHRVGGLLVGSDPVFYLWRKRVIALAARAAIPTLYEARGFVTDGGLMSYGASGLDAHRQAGIYVARILKGEKPADLPVMQPTKYQLVVNLITAKALGITVPPTLLARADEVLE
jgi:putative ABC transport system substrate-binding protein